MSNHIEVVRRADGWWHRTVTGHLGGPHRTRKDAVWQGAVEIARAMRPGDSPRGQEALAHALITQDPARPFVQQFADGWRVWNPSSRSFVGAASGGPYATAAAADKRRRELSGIDDGPMFRAASQQPAAQLGLFAARENPPHGLAPLRGSPGEAVSYRELDDGMVRVRISHAGAGFTDREMSLASARAHRAKLLGFGYRDNPSARRRRNPGRITVPDAQPSRVYALVRNIHGRRLPYTLDRPHYGTVGSIRSVSDQLQNEMSDDPEASTGQTLLVATNARGEPWWVITPNLSGVYRVGSREAHDFLGIPVSKRFSRGRRRP